jgi:HAD superfamily hydrolase (TIGR01509 family)
MENSLGPRKEVKVLALDFDGVITNLDVDWNSAIHMASTIAGYDVRSLLAFYESSHGTPVFQRVSKEMEELELKALRNAEPTPFVKEFLQKVSESRIETWIVSMQSALAVEKFLQEHGLTSCFREILTREGYPCKKAQIAQVLKKSGVSPEEILLVDDSKMNITNCKELGIRSFHFARRQDAARTRKMWNLITDLIRGRNS